ncbi:MAG: hypothetical protein Q8O74_06500, partial [bacterium]|nr:hypothetical protein [bacterium]
MIQPIIPGETSPAPARDSGIMLLPDSRRVIARPQIPFSEGRAGRIIARALALDEAETNKELQEVLAGFAHRHRNFESL